jgi:hypothetical protein
MPVLLPGDRPVPRPPHRAGAGMIALRRHCARVGELLDRLLDPTWLP